MAAVEEFDIDDVEVKSDRVEKFMVEKDKKYRVGFPLLNDKGRVKIVKVDHYTLVTGSGEDEKFASFQKSSDPEVNKAVEAAGGELKSRFATLMIKYNCDKNGKPLVPLSYEILPVKLDGTKVSNLKDLNSEWDLATIDVSITSSNPTYQYHTYTPLKKAIWLLEKGDPLLEKLGMKKPIKDEVLKAAAEAESTMADAVAQKWKDATILARIGQAAQEDEEDDISASTNAELEEEFGELDEDDLA